MKILKKKVNIFFFFFYWKKSDILAFSLGGRGEKRQLCGFYFVADMLSREGTAAARFVSEQDDQLPQLYLTSAFLQNETKCQFE